MEKVRTFIAVELPEDIRERLEVVEKQLKSANADVKWVALQNFHITLKFLGSIDKDELTVVSEAMKRAIEGIPSFEITISHTGAFPRVSKPSVIWVGISDGTAQLKKLAGRLDSELELIGFEREKREFSPHITMGRARSPQGSERLRESIEALKDMVIGVVPVREITLMRSDLGPKGSTYIPINKCALSD